MSTDDPTSQDYYATLKIQQGRLRSAMLQAGIKTAAELSRLTDISQSEIGRLLNFKKSPRRKDGEWRAITFTICKALARDPEEMFPSWLDHEILTNKIEAFVTQAQLDSGTEYRQLSPYEELDRIEVNSALDNLLATLTKREEQCVRSRFFADESLADIAKGWGTSKERVRQVEAKALRKLCHPKRTEMLRPLMEELL